MPLAAPSLGLYVCVLIAQLVAFPCYAVVVCTVAYMASAVLALVVYMGQAHRWVEGILHAHVLVAYQCCYMAAFLYVSFQYGSCLYDDQVMFAPVAAGPQTRMRSADELSCEHTWDCYWISEPLLGPKDMSVRVVVAAGHCSTLEGYIVDQSYPRPLVLPLSSIVPANGLPQLGASTPSPSATSQWCSPLDNTLCTHTKQAQFVGLGVHWAQEARRCTARQTESGSVIFLAATLPRNTPPPPTTQRMGVMLLLPHGSVALRTVHLALSSEHTRREHNVPHFLRLLDLRLQPRLPRPDSGPNTTADSQFFRSRTPLLTATLVAVLGLCIAYARAVYTFHCLVAHRTSAALMYIALPLALLFCVCCCWLGLVCVACMAFALSNTRGQGRTSARLVAVGGVVCGGGQAVLMLMALQSMPLLPEGDPSNHISPWLWGHSDTNNQTIAFSVALALVLYACAGTACAGCAV